MNENILLDLAQKDGLSPKKKTANEYAGACPSCGGEDRFIVFAEENKYWCRQCHRSGDSIQYLRDFHGMGFPDAAAAVGKDIQPSFSARRKTAPAERKEPAPHKEQPAIWRERAKKLKEFAHRELMGNPEVLSWLRTERGISSETAQRFSLGWLRKDFYRQKKDWGIEPDGKKLFIPSGLVIPWKDIRIRIRRDNPGDFGRYCLVKDSKLEPLTIGDHYENTAVVVESDLDAILLSQEIKRQVFIVAIGSTSYRADEALLKQLEECPVVLICLDTDKSGAKESKWWLDNLPNAFRTLTPLSFGSDITEAFLNGLDLNVWLSATLELCCDEILRDQSTFQPEEPIYSNLD